MSCPSTGDCTATGSDGNGDPFYATETDGVWGKNGELPTAIGIGTFFGVSCAAPGDCTAAGEDFRSHPYVATEIDGRWTGAQEVAGFPQGGFGDLFAVSCASPGDCTAVGDGPENPNNGFEYPIAVTESDYVWGAPVEVLSPNGNFNGSQDAGSGQFQGISCTSPGTCTAVGADGAGGRGFYAIESGGIWVTSAEFGVTDSFEAVSCTDARDCTAVGGNAYSTESAGVWTTGTFTGLAGQLDGVSCAGAGNCVAVGQAAGAPIYMDQSAGLWGAVTSLKAPSGGDSFFMAVSCLPAVSCTAVGSDSGPAETQPLYTASGEVLGLGDSVTAGYGLGISAGHFSGNGDNPSAYPALLAKRLGIPYQNYAVEGACASSASGQFKEFDCQDRASLFTQIQEVPSTDHPSLITLSIGGNDIDFSACIPNIMFYNKGRQDPEPDIGLKSPDDRCNAKNLDDALTSFDHNLEVDLGKIKSKFPGARVLVMDYYNPFPGVPKTDGNTCELFSDAALANEYARKDKSWESAVGYYFKDHSAYLKAAASIQAEVTHDASMILGELNSAIDDDVAQAVTGGLNATVVDTSNFDNHDVCTGNSSWIFIPTGQLHLFLAGHHVFTHKFDSTPVCIDPSTNETGNDPEPVEVGEKKVFALVLEFHTNCMPHPTAEGQEQLASDFVDQGADGTGAAP